MKKIDFDELDDKVINFIKMFLLEMTEICDQKGIDYFSFKLVSKFVYSCFFNRLPQIFYHFLDLGEIFTKTHLSKELAPFREALRVFIEHFIVSQTNFWNELPESQQTAMEFIMRSLRKKDEAFLL